MRNSAINIVPCPESKLTVASKEDMYNLLIYFNMLIYIYIYICNLSISLSIYLYILYMSTYIYINIIYYIYISIADDWLHETLSSK